MSSKDLPRKVLEKYIWRMMQRVYDGYRSVEWLKRKRKRKRDEADGTEGIYDEVYLLVVERWFRNLLALIFEFSGRDSGNLGVFKRAMGAQDVCTTLYVEVVFALHRDMERESVAVCLADSNAMSWGYK